MKDLFRRPIFDKSFGASFLCITIVNWICMGGTISIVHKFGIGGPNFEFALVLGISVASLLIAPRLLKIVASCGSSIKGRLPLHAEFLFYLFLDAKNCDALLGDLEERYKLIAKKFGPRRANFWYWTQAIRSVGPIVRAWTKKAALKPVIGIVGWASAKGLIGHESWLAALVEIWKRIRS